MTLAQPDHPVVYITEKLPRFEETICLYHSVGWTRYTDSPDGLMAALQNSTYVISAYQKDQLIGLIRGLSDSVSIHLIQDLLVHPKDQRRGIGSTLIKKALGLYPEAHKHVLLTDDEQFQRLFYESLRFQNLNLVQPKLNVYIKIEILD